MGNIQSRLQRSYFCAICHVWRVANGFDNVVLIYPNINEKHILSFQFLFSYEFFQTYFTALKMFIFETFNAVLNPSDVEIVRNKQKMFFFRNAMKKCNFTASQEVLEI
jgi:hypothetical protein